MADAEPKFTSESQLQQALNWYAANHNFDDSKMWFEAYLIKRNLPVPKNGFNVGNIGFLCRMIDRGFPETPYVIQKIEARYEEWKSYVAPKRSSVEKEAAPEKEKKEAVKPAFSEALIEDLTNFSTALDENYWAEGKTISSFQRFHFSPKINNGDAKIIVEEIQNEISVLESVAKMEKEYQQCYPSQAHIKRLVAWLNAIVETRKSLMSMNKKPKKEIPAIKQVSEMKYEKMAGDIKGLHPEKVVGCNAVLLYNTKTRRIMYYESRSAFFARGTRFFEINSHHCRTLRKPETQLKDLMELTKPQVRAYIDKLSGVNGGVADRMNEHVVVLRVWK